MAGAGRTPGKKNKKKRIPGLVPGYLAVTWLLVPRRRSLLEFGVSLFEFGVSYSNSVWVYSNSVWVYSNSVWVIWIRCELFEFGVTYLNSVWVIWIRCDLFEFGVTYLNSVWLSVWVIWIRCDFLEFGVHLWATVLYWLPKLFRIDFQNSKFVRLLKLHSQLRFSLPFHNYDHKQRTLKQRARSIQPKFQLVRPGKVVHLKS